MYQTAGDLINKMSDLGFAACRFDRSPQLPNPFFVFEGNKVYRIIGQRLCRAIHPIGMEFRKFLQEFFFSGQAWLQRG